MPKTSFADFPDIVISGDRTVQADPKFAGLKVGVLALQGAFAEHCDGFRRLGVKEVREVRVRAELEGLDGLAMPGGESTAMVLIAQPNGEGGVMKVSEEHDILSGLTDWVHEKKMPTWGTCAGMILLSDRLTKDTQKIGGQGVIGGFDMTVSRNFFGRQLQSFEAPLTCAAMGDKPYNGIFIRGPAILEFGEGVEGLCSFETHRQGHPVPETVTVAARQAHLLGCSFHPELTADLRWHTYFLEMMLQDLEVRRTA